MNKRQAKKLVTQFMAHARHGKRSKLGMLSYSKGYWPRFKKAELVLKRFGVKVPFPPPGKDCDWDPVLWEEI